MNYLLHNAQLNENIQPKNLIKLLSRKHNFA